MSHPTIRIKMQDVLKLLFPDLDSRNIQSMKMMMQEVSLVAGPDTMLVVHLREGNKAPTLEEAHRVKLEVRQQKVHTSTEDLFPPDEGAFSEILEYVHNWQQSLRRQFPDQVLGAIDPWFEDFSKKLRALQGE